MVLFFSVIKENKKTNKKVFVGLSGGVDSSVSALLLKEEGYDVTGVFIKAWHPDFLPFNWRTEMRDAMRVCAKLDIPFLLCDLEKEYKKEVIDYLIDEYSIGRTPNPDVLCNKEIKFGAFIDWATEKGADYVATGHYAQNKESRLLNAVDTEKDQTYFLWTVTKDKLEKILFPIGHLPKSAVRKLADKNNLHTATKKDSQGLCFIGHVDMKTFLRRYIDTEKGSVLNTKNEVIGSHDGSELYTVGERHGFTIFENKEDRKTHYVISKDLKNNTITVSDEVKKDDKVSEIKLSNVNITNPDYIEKIKDGLDLQVKIRYRGSLHNAKLEGENEHMIILEEPISSVANGQSVVFYLKNECLGGGVANNI
jgi:tRNA-specific 2-thiouridylase